MPGDYLALAASVAVFAALLGVIYKLSDFTVKLRDPEIENVKTEFHRYVIAQRLAEQNRDAEWLRTLTDELTLPRELDADLRYGETYGKYCLLSAVVGMILFAAYFSGAVLDYTLSGLVFFAAIVTGIALFVFFMLDVQWLSYSRRILVTMRDKINERQTATVLGQTPAHV